MAKPINPGTLSALLSVAGSLTPDVWPDVWMGESSRLASKDWSGLTGPAPGKGEIRGKTATEILMDEYMTAPLSDEYKKALLTAGSTASGASVSSDGADAMSYISTPRGHGKSTKWGDFFDVKKPEPVGTVPARLRVMTVRQIKRFFPELQGVALSRAPAVDFTYSNDNFIYEALVEILHKADFGRERFGYGNHRGFSDNIECAVRGWNLDLHEKLQECLAKHAHQRLLASDPVAAEEAAKKAAAEKAEMERQAEEAAKVAALLQKAAHEEKARRASDPINLPTDLVETLSRDTQRALEGAAEGVW